MVYLLVGLTGSGKTTYAKRRLEPAGVTRLSVDERVYARHGRYGVDYPERDYFALETPVVAEVRNELVDLVAAGRSAVLDHGLWTRKERDEWRQLIREAGGHPRLLYFPVPREELLRRLNERNGREDANALTVTESALDDFYARFEPPTGEDEEIIEPGSFCRSARLLRDDALRLSVREFAAYLGVSDGAVSKWEAGGDSYRPRTDEPLA
ncbi:AAA family ATPase [Streptomyces sp. YC419]|uniref:AAA family ATPase n=1 Tax=Streptomyces ureilyticus TaxID=1775131 RepID=A0ABX0DWV4_9ACTN|nr:AAA family ATPase [Streptomyces ureilyticus]